MMDAQELAQKIDHTNVGRDATWNDIEKLCDEAELYGFRNVCVTPTQTARASKFLENSSVGVCTVIGFPFGVQTLYSKAFEVKDAIDNGANELDMVLNVGALHSGDDNLVYRDIRGVVLAAGGKVVKVIFETGLLSSQEKVRACHIAQRAGAHYVKTSTGIGTTGATVEDVKLMRQNIKPEMKIKAAGGIRDLETALAMIKAGASRIGTSSGVQIMEGLSRV
ncbi:MAG: deoxyribose-phosphate aldolase [Euryarchaeota archaeon]|jgi:deoxyribose-phosphate aldolase|nr:deoxyribose-phosphate aldolase [Euryarchaeota archaeon]